MTGSREGTRSARAAALRTVIGVVLFGGTAIAILHDWFGLGGAGVSAAINGPLYDMVIVAAGLACLLKAAGAGRERRAWLLIAGAILFWAAAEIYWTLFIEGSPEPPFPTPADIGYLAFYPLAAGGLYLLVKARAEELDWRLWMDGAIAALGTAALAAALIFQLVADRTEGGGLEVAVNLSDPLGDIVLASMAVGIVALTRWRPGRAWTLLLVGLVLSSSADVAYTLQSYGVVPGGDWVEPIYLLSAAFVGSVAWQPEVRSIDPQARFDGWRELIVPGIVAVAMTGLGATQYIGGANLLTTLLWAVTMLAVIVRMAMSINENKRLLEMIRTDRLTGLGSQGQLGIDLARRVSRAGAEPLTLMTLDLNGFKRFNDTFGHPAGDEMLRQLGGQLRDALGTTAAGYRIGGDEFAVLVSGRHSAGDARVAGIAAALSARGSGFEIGASWGAVAIPGEAADPDRALQLADERMYAQKELLRLDRGPEPELRLTVPRSREALEQSQ